MEEKINFSILTGRPFGGSAILVSNRLTKHTNSIITNSSRLTAVELTNNKQQNMLLAVFTCHGMMVLQIILLSIYLYLGAFRVFSIDISAVCLFMVVILMLKNIALISLMKPCSYFAVLIICAGLNP